MSVTIEAPQPTVDRYTLISTCVKEVISTRLSGTFAWLFNPFDPLHRKLAEENVIEQIYDHWTAVERYENKRWFGKPKEVTLERVVKGFYDDEFFASFKRWCRMSGQNSYIADHIYRLPTETPSSDKKQTTKEQIAYMICDMLIRNSIFRHLPEAVRSENGVSNLFFHTARLLIGQSNGLIDATSQKRIKSASSAASADTMDRVQKEYAFLFDGDIRFLYDLMRRVSFQRGVDLKYFLTKDDLNSNCHCKPFIKCFLTKKDLRGPQDRPAYLFRFEAAFMSNKLGYATNDKQILEVLGRCKTRVTSSPENQLTAYKETEEDKKLRLNFAGKWKTYVDQVGYIPGYAAFIANYCISTCIQLAVLAATLFVAQWDFLNYLQTNPILYIALCAVPIAVAVLFILIAIPGRLLTYPWRHPHFFSIPRRDSKVPLRYSFTMLWSNLMNMLVWIIVFGIQYFILKFALFYQLDDATRVILDYKGDMGNIDFILAIVSLVLAWAPIFLITFTITPIIFYAIICVMNTSSEFLQYCSLELFYNRYSNSKLLFSFHISGLWNCFTMAIYGIHSRHLFKRRMRDERTLRFFAEKLLNNRYPSNDKDQQALVRRKFAELYNYIIQEFYEECLVSAEEREQLSFKIGQDSVITKEPKKEKKSTLFKQSKKASNDKKKKNEIDSTTSATASSDAKTEPVSDDQASESKDDTITVGWFERDLYRIYNLKPKNPIATYQLVRFINYLWNPTVPRFTSVEHMRATRVTVPVYNETIIESFKKITDWENTNTSFLEHVINKHPDEWINFKNKPKYTDKDRKKLKRLEEAVFAKKKDIYLSILDRKEDEQLKLDVRIWASNRFQFVCRTIKGASKSYDGLRFLLKLQSNVDDRVADQIMKRKFKLYIGAQVYSKREEYQQYCEDFDTMLGMFGKKGMHMCYQRIKNNRCEAVMRTSTNTGDDVSARSMGDFIMGQGKPCHQAFLLQFFNGTINECIDCNQDFNTCQSFFIPAVVDEFSKDVRVKIVGFKEYITTMHWSAAGYGAGYSEKVFGSIVQKSWTMLGVRFHYGHPDFVRGTGVFYETGLSKLDVVSEDIFLGIDSMLGGGLIRYIDYYEVGKARDVCIDTTSAFQSKIAGGARHVCNSRQIQEFMTPLFYNPFKQLSIYQTTIGHYLSAVLVVLSCITLAVIRIILSIMAFVLESRESAAFKRVYDNADSFFFIQLGVALSVPGLFQALVDTGIAGLVSYFVYLKFLVQTVFSAFHILNTAYYFNASFNNVPTYLASGRTPGLTHKDIRTVFNNYYKTHFRTCLFLAICLVVVLCLRWEVLPFFVNSILIAIWMWSPFLFNRGSFSITVGEHTWKLLTREDWHFVHSFGVRAIFKKDKVDIDPKLLRQPPCILRPFLSIRRKARHAITFIRGVYCWLLNYVYIGVCLTGVQYINILLWLVPIVFPFWAHKPRDEFYEERKKDLLQSTVTDLEAWSVQITDEEARIKGEIKNMEGQVNNLKMMQNDLRSQLQQNSAAIKHIQENGVFGNGNGEGMGPDGAMDMTFGDGGPPPPPPPPPPMMDMDEFARMQKEKREKALDIPPEIVPIIKAQVGDSKLNQATDDDLQGMMGSELADMVIKSLNLDFKQVLDTLKNSFEKYEDNWAKKEEEGTEFPEISEMIGDLRQLLRELPRGVDLQKLREITKMQNLKDWTESDIAVINKIIGFWGQIEEILVFEQVIDKARQSILKGEDCILAWGEANRAANRMSNGRARSLRTNLEDLQSKIPTEYQNMLDKYREVTQGNIPVLQGLRAAFKDKFDAWNAQWRQMIGVFQFRYGMIYLRSNCILHTIFDEWYYDAVVSRQKKLTVLQLRNARTKIEKVIGAFTQAQAFFKKNKELFAMHLDKLDIEIKDFPGYENVDEEVVVYIKGLFSSDMFVDTRDAWIEHNTILGAQFKHLGTYEEEDENAECSVERDEEEREAEAELLYQVDDWHEQDVAYQQKLKAEEEEALRLLKEARGPSEEEEKKNKKKKKRPVKKVADDEEEKGTSRDPDVEEIEIVEKDEK